MLFQHAGFRSLWPVALFLPWLLVGVAYLVAAMIHGTREVRPLSVPVRRSLQARPTSPAPAPRRRGFLRSWAEINSRKDISNREVSRLAGTQGLEAGKEHLLRDQLRS